MFNKVYKRKIISIMILICFILEGIVFGTTENIEDNPYIKQNLEYQLTDENGNLKIYSEAAILIEQSTGEILYEKNAYDKKYPASTTKILTAILAIEKCNLQEIAIASETSVFSVKSGYTIADIQVGERFTIEQLLDVMMLQSANEAANIIAEHISGSIQEFANLMNQKAKEIGCQNTHFVNANGAHDNNHYSTAYDMALIANYCMKNEKFKEISKKMECSLPMTESWQEERTFKNTNSLMIRDNKYYYPYCTGIKTGFTTPAKNCLISSSNKDGYELISVILHAESTDEGLSARYLDTINLLNYGYNNYNIEDIQEEYDLIEYIEENNNNVSDNENELSRNGNINVDNIESRSGRNVDASLINFGEKDYKELSTLNDNSNNSFYKIIILFGIISVFLIIKRLIYIKKVKRKKSKLRAMYNKMYHFKYDID